jgi:hypothetical protein
MFNRLNADSGCSVVLARSRPTDQYDILGGFDKLATVQPSACQLLVL